MKTNLSYSNNSWGMRRRPRQHQNTRAGPVRSSSLQSGPVRSSLVQSGPGRSSPVQSGPVWSSPVQTGPVRSSLVQAGPVRSSSVQSGPFQSSPVHFGPVWSSPVHFGPFRSSPVQAGPAWLVMKLKNLLHLFHQRFLMNLLTCHVLNMWFSLSLCLHGNRSLFQNGEFLFHFSNCRPLTNIVTALLSLFQYTEEQGRRLGLAGWVKNTSRGTVVGQVQGPAPRVEEMSVPTSLLITNQTAGQEVL